MCVCVLCAEVESYKQGGVLKVSLVVKRCFQAADKCNRRDTAERVSWRKKGSDGDREPSHASVPRLQVCSERVFVSSRDSCKGNPSFPPRSLSHGLLATDPLPSLRDNISALVRPGCTNKAVVTRV